MDVSRVLLKQFKAAMAENIEGFVLPIDQALIAQEAVLSTTGIRLDLPIIEIAWRSYKRALNMP